jgi:hypothetical protein
MCGKATIILCLFGLAGFSVFLFDRVYLPPPKFLCDKKEHNFGIVPSEGKVFHTFVFQNTGGRTLRITNARTSCTCTNVEIPNRDVEPGEQGEITVELRIDSFLETIGGAVVVETNDPQLSNARFTVVAYPAQKLSVVPPLVNMGTVSYADIGSRKVELEIKCKDTKALSFDIKDIVSPSPIHARLLNLEGPGRPRLAVWLDPGMPIGRLTATIFLYDKTEMEPVEVPIRGNVTGAVKIEPDLAYFGFIKANAVSSKLIHITPESTLVPFRVSVEYISPVLTPYVATSLIEKKDMTFVEIRVANRTLKAENTRNLSGIVRLRCELGTRTAAYVNIPISGVLESEAKM